MPDSTRIAAGPIAAVDRLSGFFAQISAFLLWGIFVLISAEVIARNAFNTSIHFSWDYAGYLMGAVFMLAAPEALHRGAHVRVTALRNLFAPRIRRLLDLAACLVGLLILAALAWALGSMTWFSVVRGTTSATISLTPLWIPQSVMTLGCVLACLQMLAQLLRVVSGEELTGDSDLAEV
jgi:TRAP-type C4-dicarboxylate transport system permease small subunit